VKLPEPSFPLLSERILMRRPTGRGSGWMNVKHRHYRRFGQELERAYRRRQRVALV